MREYASGKLVCAMKVKGMPCQPTLICCEGFEWSTLVGTRKMVNYAWVG